MIKKILSIFSGGSQPQEVERPRIKPSGAITANPIGVAHRAKQAVVTPPPPRIDPLEAVKDSLLLQLERATETYYEREELCLELEEKRSDLQDAISRAKQEIDDLEGNAGKQEKTVRQTNGCVEEVFIPSWEETDSIETLRVTLRNIEHHADDLSARSRTLEQENDALSKRLGKSSRRLGNLKQGTASKSNGHTKPKGNGKSSTEFVLAKTNVAIKIPDTLDELETWAKEHLADKVTILPRALKEARTSGYEHVKTLYHALLLLAHEYRDQIVVGDRGTHQQFNRRLQELYMRIGKTHSSTSGKLQLSRYTFEYDGQPTFFDMHLKKGNSRDPRHCLRIYFTFDKGTKKVVIGHMPTHLHNALS